MKQTAVGKYVIHLPGYTYIKPDHAVIVSQMRIKKSINQNQNKNYKWKEIQVLEPRSNLGKHQER